MTDQQLEARLRAWYGANDGWSAPHSLAVAVDAIPETVPAPRGFDLRLPAARRQLTLLVAALLLAVALVGAIAIGSGLVRLPWTVDVEAEPPLFGAATDCGATGPYLEGALLEATVGTSPGEAGSAWVIAFDDGRLLTIDPWYPSIEATYIDQRLTPRGVEMMRSALGDAGLTPGCRFTHTDGTPLHISAILDEGVVEAGFGSAYAAELAAVMSAEEVLLIDTLAAQIRSPEGWLPPEAWVDPTRREYRPDHWRVSIQWFRDQTSAAHQEHHFPDGTVMTAESLDLARIRLPGGATLDSFGIEMPRPEGGPAPEEAGERCGFLATDDAQAFAGSLGAAGASHVPHDAWEIFSEDFSTNYMVQIMAALDGRTCAEIGQSYLGPAEPIPTPSPPPSGDLTQADVCALVGPEAVRAALGLDMHGTQQPSWLAFDVASSACLYMQGEGWASTVQIHLRGASTDLPAARYHARALFGDGMAEEQVSGRTVWLHACLVSRPDCTGAVAISADPYFLVVIVDRYTPAIRDTAEAARQLAATIAAEISD